MNVNVSATITVIRSKLRSTTVDPALEPVHERLEPIGPIERGPDRIGLHRHRLGARERPGRGHLARPRRRLDDVGEIDIVTAEPLGVWRSPSLSTS